jgi:hypothetical protein
VLLSSGDSFPHLIQKPSSQLGFVTYLLNYLRIFASTFLLNLYFPLVASLFFSPMPLISNCIYNIFAGYATPVLPTVALPQDKKNYTLHNVTAGTGMPTIVRRKPAISETNCYVQRAGIS